MVVATSRWAQELLDCPNVVTRLEQRRRKAVTQAVTSSWLGELCRQHGRVKCLLKHGLMKVETI